MRKCGNCGTLLEEGVKKCPKCGKDVCINCGNVLGHGVTKCPKCGEATVLGGIQSCSAVAVIIGFVMMAIGLIIAFSLGFLGGC